jgi:hypothetical protein
MIDVEVKRVALVESILKDICKDEAFICGGFARVTCSPKANPIPSKDIDIYLLDEANFDKIVSRIEKAMYVKVKENDVSYVFEYALDSRDTHLQLNLIKPIHTGHLHTFGDLDTILENFDFTIARIGIWLDGETIKARADEDFIEDENNGILNIKNIHCPIAEIPRIAKYQSKGYRCPLIMVLRCFMDWDERDPEFKSFLINNLAKDKKLSTEDIQELYKRLYID